MNNVLKFWYRPTYYLTHPIKFFKELKANLINAWMRITKGYCYTDIWNLNTWFCLVLPPMLRHMADYGMAYPGGEPFETPEKWHDWLHSMADVIDTFEDEDYWYTNKNEYSEKWEELTDKARKIKKNEKGYTTITYEDSVELDKIKQLYFARMEEISKERQALIENTFMEIARAFDCLWD